MIKVLEVITAFDVGGAERLLANRLSESAKNAPYLETTVIYLKGNGTLVRQDSRSAKYRKYDGILPLWREIVASNIVHVHLLHALLVAAPLCILLRKPLFFTLHNIKYRDDWRDNIINAILRLILTLLPDGSSYIAISRSVERYARVTLTLKKSEVIYVPNGVPPQINLPPELGVKNEAVQRRNRKFVALFVGRLEPQKRPDWAIKALSRLKQSADWELWILGTGTLEAQLNELTSKSGITEQVIFLGTTNSTRKYYEAADVLLLPSAFEGFGLVVIEAFLAGIPVVASNIEGPAELICDNFDGRLFDKNSIDDFISCWESVAIHIDEYKERAKNSSSKTSVYSINNHSQTLTKLYKDSVQFQQYNAEPHCI